MLFSNDNIQVQWAEPSGFRFKAMGRSALRAPLITFFVALSVGVIICVAYYARSGRRPGNDSVETTASILLISVVVAIFPEVLKINRFIKISPHRIRWGLPDNTFMFLGLWMFICAGSRRFSTVKHIVLRRPKEDENRFDHGVMEIIPNAGKPFLIGIAKEIGLENLAQLLHDNRVAVTLSGWTPSNTGASGTTLRTT